VEISAEFFNAKSVTGAGAKPVRLSDRPAASQGSASLDCSKPGTNNPGYLPLPDKGRQFFVKTNAD
jgi:hypothetical protein